MSLYTASVIKHWQGGKRRKVLSDGISEQWIPARSINYQFDPLRYRIKWAWGVLTGKYDALDWEENQ